jgi:hypothetical protein
LTLCQKQYGFHYKTALQRMFLYARVYIICPISFGTKIMTPHSPRTISLLLIFILFALTASVMTQDSGCPVDVQLALEQSGELCINIGPDQVCYGNRQVTIEAQSQVEELLFEIPGDLEDVANVRSLYLSEMNLETNTWGIAHMRLLVNTAALQPTDVRLVLFGDVALGNLAENRVELPTTVMASVYINVRQYPMVTAGAVSVLAPRQEVIAIGRLYDYSWLRVKFVTDEETEIIGWVSADLLRVDGDIQTLTPESAYDPFYSPMQAFTYSSGSSTSCASITSDGLLVQTPEGQARVTFLINEVSIDLHSGQTGSTSFVQAEPSGDMAVTVFEGSATVTSGGTSFTAIAGSQITIPLGDDLLPSAPPNAPQPFDPTFAEGLLATGVVSDVSALPATWDAIDIANGAEVPTPIDGEPAPTAVPTDDKEECPGKSCEAQGHNKKARSIVSK